MYIQNQQHLWIFSFLPKHIRPRGSHMTGISLDIVVWNMSGGWLVEFYGIPTFVGYLTPNPLLYKYSVLF